MPTFAKCPKAVTDLANEILAEFETHHPVMHAKVLIDFVFAYCDRDDQTQAPKNYALTKGGMRALGICRKISLKDRAQGRGDVEIAIDGDWWNESTREEIKGLLDHELHHIAVKIDDRGVVTDDLGRPIVQMRKHDVEVGWFKIVASRHGKNSQERLQAAQILCDHGQYFWPGLVQPHTDVQESAARSVRTARQPIAQPVAS